MSRFIVFGGLDETGKTTQSKHLVDYLNHHGVPAIWTREPGGTQFGAEIRSILLQPSLDLSPRTLLLLFQAAREEHLEQVIRPALKEGKWVITDRFFESSYIYQGMMGLSDEMLLTMHRTLGQHRPSPDFHVLFTGKVGSRGIENGLDAFCDENRRAMEERVHRFSSLVPSSILSVGGKSEEDVFTEILSVLKCADLELPTT